jgi:hypothetical protein
MMRWNEMPFRVALNRACWREAILGTVGRGLKKADDWDHAADVHPHFTRLAPILRTVSNSPPSSFHPLVLLHI